MEKRLTFREFVEKLRKKFPSDKPIRVRRTQMPFDKTLSPPKRLYGDADIFNKPYSTIRINKNIPLYYQKDTLMHEWAHCLSNPTDNDDDEGHSPAWGRAYARIYRHMIDDIGT